MRGLWYIDGIDIFAKYNIGIVRDGFNDLFVFPSFKDLYYNDWPENDGIDIDLSDPKLNNKTVDLKFASVTRDNEMIDSFIVFLTQPGYRTLTMTTLGRSWQLRLNKESARNVESNAQMFTLQFYDDFPRDLILIYPNVLGSENREIITTEDGEYLIDMSSSETQAKGHGFNFPHSDYKLDDIAFSEYGLAVNKGKAEICKIPDLKTNLEINIGTLDSVIYDTSFNVFKQKDVTLECSFFCKTLDMFWNNYIAFFSDLIKPESRLLEVDYMNDVFDCHYKSSSDFKIEIHPSYILCQFNLVLAFINSRPKITIQVLGSENDDLIITENNEYLIEI